MSMSSRKGDESSPNDLWVIVRRKESTPVVAEGFPVSPSPRTTTVTDARFGSSRTLVLKVKLV